MSTSAFGIEHGGVSKAFGNVAGRLARAASTAKPGSAAHTYATSRLAAGQQGAGVAGNMRAAKTPLKSLGARNMKANEKIVQGNKSATKAARVGRKTGAANAKAARGAVGGTGSFKAISAPAAAPAAAAPAAASSGGKVPLWGRAAGVSNRTYGLGALGVGGAAAGGGGALYANRKRSA